MKTFNLTTLACLTVTLFAMPQALCQTGNAQTVGESIQVDTVKQIDVISGSSRRIKFDYDIPDLLVENMEVIKATPISPSEILVTGLKAGVSSITVSDQYKNLQTVNINVIVDTRRLEFALKQHFPDASIKVHALKTGVVLAGTVSRPDDVANIVAVARDYFPANVVNHMKIDAPQKVSIKVKVYEVSRTKLRALGVDWAVLNSDTTIGTSISNLINNIGIGNTARDIGASGQTLTFGVIGNNTDFAAFFEALEQHNIAKLLDQPTLVAQHGRPAEFLSGGEIPISVASGLGSVSIEFRPFGTKLDIVPLIHGHGEVTLEVRAEVSEIANDLSNNTGVPGFRVRRVNTGIRMKAGHTLALAGDYREETETEKRGIPGVMHSPIFGTFFGRKEEQKTETELVFMITPRFISEVDPTALPRIGVGQNTDSPSNHEFYRNGYIEVPRCNDDCPTNDRFDDPVQGHKQLGQELKGQINQPSTFNLQGQGYPDTTDAQSPKKVSFFDRLKKPTKAVPKANSVPTGQTTASGFGWPKNANNR